MKLSYLLEVLPKYTFFGKDADVISDIEVELVTSRSNEVRKNTLFVCIKGLMADGHDYIESAVSLGACVVVAKNGCKVDADIPIIYVENTRIALSLLCARYYSDVHNKMKIIGITGTNGKTTTSRMLYEILKCEGISCGLIGTTGIYLPNGKLSLNLASPAANMTTPDPEELYSVFNIMYKNGVTHVIMEVSSHSLYFDKVYPINFYMGAFTNLTCDHMDLHKSMEEYYKAKKKLFLNCKKCIINIDDVYGRRLSDELMYPIKCSCDGRISQYTATNVKYIPERGIEYKLQSRLTNLRIKTNTLGDFNLINSLMASAMAIEMSVSDKSVISAMQNFFGSDGRMEKVILPNGAEFTVIIDYAHTPDALEKLLLSVKRCKTDNSRIILVFGCGGDRDRTKRKSMGRIATEYADLTVITSDNPRHEEPLDIINEIMLGVNKEAAYKMVVDRKQAIFYAIDNARRGDIILLAGKGHEDYEIIGDKKYPFSEKETVLLAYGKKYGISG